MAAPIYLIRHGQTAQEDSLGGKGIIGGWLDLHLNPEGRKESQTLALTLAQHPLVRLISSDLSRAVETAQIVFKKLKPSPQMNVSQALRTWNLGDLAGKPVESVKDEIDKLVDKKFSPAPGGGETFDDFTKRVLQFTVMVMNNASRMKEDEGIALVTHGRPIQIIKVWIERGESALNSKAASGKHAGVETGQALILSTTGQGWTTQELKNG